MHVNMCGNPVQIFPVIDTWNFYTWIKLLNCVVIINKCPKIVKCFHQPLAHILTLNRRYPCMNELVPLRLGVERCFKYLIMCAFKKKSRLTNGIC